MFLVFCIVHCKKIQLDQYAAQNSNLWRNIISDTDDRRMQKIFRVTRMSIENLLLPGLSQGGFCPNPQLSLFAPAQSALGTFYELKCKFPPHCSISFLWARLFEVNQLIIEISGNSVVFYSIQEEYRNGLSSCRCAGNV
jgi:hypothetical protein